MEDSGLPAAQHLLNKLLLRCSPRLAESWRNSPIVGTVEVQISDPPLVVLRSG